MNFSPFLTDIDERARIKGSRDPLGIQPIWARFGRHVVGNLTTITTSAREFSVLLIGFYFAEMLADEDDTSALETFLKWEQIAAYARVLKDREVFVRGVERVKRILNEDAPIIISADRQYQIMSNQKTYGLWGLYSVAARNSGLIERDENQLTPDARRFVEDQYITPLGVHVKTISGILKARRSEIKPKDANRDLFKTLGALLGRVSVAERDFYRSALLLDEKIEPPQTLQKQLAGMVEANETGLLEDGFEWTPKVVAALAAKAKKNGWGDLADRLERIRTAESFLAPPAYLFDYLQVMHGRTVSSVAEDVGKEWGEKLTTVDQTHWDNVAGELSDGNAEYAELWGRIVRCMSEGNYKTSIVAVLGLNAKVMMDRGGAPWIVINNGKLDVRYVDERAELPKRNELKNLWRHSYFLDPLRTLALELRGAK